MIPPEPDRTLAWMRQGTGFFVSQLAALDGDLGRPSLLPGWTRAHVAAHVARNAEALSRLVSWARTGTETPMYASVEQRADEIEESSRKPPPQLRAEVAATAADLDEALASLDDDRWQAQVRSAKGRLIPAAEIPWMRVREVWLHAVDLGAGAALADIPADIVDCLLDDVAAAFDGRDAAPSLRLEPTDRSRTWAVQTDRPDVVTVRAAAAELVGWLVGRRPADELVVRGADRAPSLPAWL